MRIFSWIATLVLAALPVHADSVVTYHNSIHRTGAYRIPALTLAAAAKVSPDRAFKGVVSGHVYAQPLYWQPKGAGHGLVIVATESNIVYALDEVSGTVVWQTKLAAPVPRSDLPCGNIDPDGITGTPVIDPATGTLYLSALTKTKNGPRHLLYGLSLADGSIVPKYPLDVQAALATAGTSFDSSIQGSRSALLFFGSNLYVVYGGRYGDCGAYRGTVTQFQTQPPKLVADWQTRANGGGIWAQGGIAGDGAALFVTTGNTFGASQWSDGEAIIKLRPGLAHSTNAKDYFAPSNWKDLDNSDADLGGTEALPLDVAVGDGTRAKRVIAFGKDGNAYLADRNNLGGVGGQLAVTKVSNSRIITAPAIFETDTATMIAFSNSSGGNCSGNSITMLRVAPSGNSPISTAWCASYSGAGAPIVTTTDGKANAIVWAVGAEGDNELHGFDANSGAVVFSGNGTAMSGVRHFSTVLATPKRFYVAADNRIYAFKIK